MIDRQMGANRFIADVVAVYRPNMKRKKKDDDGIYGGVCFVRAARGCSNSHKAIQVAASDLSRAIHTRKKCGIYK